MNTKTLCLSASLLVLSLQASSQVVAPTKVTTPNTKSFVKDSIRNTDNTLAGQYKFMLSRSKIAPDGFKLVNPNRLDNLIKNFSDSLNKERNANAEIAKQFAESKKTITYLETEMANKEKSLLEKNTRLNEISVFGFGFDKTNYSITLFTLIFGLIAALIFVIIRSAKSVLEAKTKTEMYDELTKEHQNYKAKANEKERKLARELQDERNKLEEFRNNK